MNKSIFILISLCLLLLSSCYVDEFGPPNLSYLCHADSLGVLHKTDLPAGSGNVVGIQRLKDGRALIISNKLHLWNPYNDAMTDITPSGFVSGITGSNVAVSSDGQHYYFPAGGKIKRRDLNGNVEETLVDWLNAVFFGLNLSRDERYLCFIKSTKDAYNNIVYKGYPLYLNLISGEVTSLPQAGTLVTNAIVDSFRERIYYTQENNLYTMELDGSHRALVFADFCNALLSGDGNFMVNGWTGDGTHPQYYRDNRIMGWSFFETTGQNALARDVNLLYYSKLKKLFAMNLDSGMVSTILPDIIFGHQVVGVRAIAPAWNGKDLVCMVILKDEE